MSELSPKARADLRVALGKSYGEEFERSLPDEYVDTIGMLLLTIMYESVMLKGQQNSPRTPTP